MMATEGIYGSAQENTCSHDTLSISPRFKWQPGRRSTNQGGQLALQQLCSQAAVTALLQKERVAHGGFSSPKEAPISGLPASWVLVCGLEARCLHQRGTWTWSPHFLSFSPV